MYIKAALQGGHSVTEGAWSMVSPPQSETLQYMFQAFWWYIHTENILFYFTSHIFLYNFLDTNTLKSIHFYFFLSFIILNLIFAPFIYLFISCFQCLFGQNHEEINMNGWIIRGEGVMGPFPLFSFTLFWVFFLLIIQNFNSWEMIN